MSKIGVSESVPKPEARDAAPAATGENWEQPLGLADRFDELLLRLEVWRERPRVAGSLIVASALLAVVAWWLAQPAEPIPVEDYIPLASQDGPVDDSDRPVGTAPEDGVEPDPNPSMPVEGEIGQDDPGDLSPAVEVETLVVHVVGAVQRPGLVQVAPGARIDDVLRAAGGPTEQADVERLNLAAPVADGMQVRVPSHGEDPDGVLIVAPPPVTSAVESADDAPAGPINLNTASESKLQELPGVGPATAAAIVAWRDDNGGFLSVDDLTQVPGIGPVKLAALRELVTV